MCVDWMHLGDQLCQIESCGIDYLHIDIIDGLFAPDFTMGSSIINVVRDHVSLPFDYHLMVNEPSRLFGSFNIIQNDIYTIHQECSRNLHRDLVKIKQQGSCVGVALSPGTSLESLEYVIEDVDVVLLMTVNPGYMGQPLVPQVLRKVEKLRKLLDNMKLDVRISVDGNVNKSTISDMVAAGSDMLVLGSSGLFRRDVSFKSAIADIHDAIDKSIGAGG
jgi:ribulose-phosphate 3-epimerase